MSAPPLLNAANRRRSPVTVLCGVAHHRDDFLDRRRVSRVTHPLVVWRAAGVVARQVRRRATSTSRIQR
jgi:hypothetical protein